MKVVFVEWFHIQKRNMEFQLYYVELCVILLGIHWL